MTRGIPSPIVRRTMGLDVRTWIVAMAFTGAASAVTAVTAPASAQAAADKATARQLALDAIKLFKAGKYAEALDKMQRAQSLYDAPIHLLYVARAQEKVGQLVDASETYRRLVRTTLDAGAPEAFVTAVEDGKKELVALEPRIPSLRIDVVPPNVADMDLRIDGAKVSSAVVGVDRPANPGSHTIRVSAPGFKAAEKTIQLQEKQSLTVPLELQPDESGGAVAPVPPPQAGQPPSAAQPSPGPGATPGDGAAAPAAERGGIGFMVGLRIGGAIPGGNVMSVAGTDLRVDEFTKNGFGGGLNGGVRFLKHFTPFLYAEGYVHGVGPGLDQVPSPGVELTTTITHRAGGLGLMAHTERGKFGGFGEIGLGLLHEFVVSEQASGGGLSCTVDTTLSGSAFRLGGGAMIPLAGDVFHLTPYANISLATFNNIEVKRAGSAADCGDLGGGTDGNSLNELDVGSTDIPESAQSGHTVFTVGIGGSFLFGGG